MFITTPKRKKERDGNETMNQETTLVAMTLIHQGEAVLPLQSMLDVRSVWFALFVFHIGATCGQPVSFGVALIIADKILRRLTVS